MGDFHRGQDYVAQCGTSVMAAATGTVTFVGWHQYGGGNRVVVDHGNGLETTYNHLSSFNVTEGQTVSRGDVIALSGTTGASTGCHLHFEVQVNGEVVDPTGWL
jgi:murein DD-endopeptidase MepM/ murein hydrolase activator NlpD